MPSEFVTNMISCKGCEDGTPVKTKDGRRRHVQRDQFPNGYTETSWPCLRKLAAHPPARSPSPDAVAVTIARWKHRLIGVAPESGTWYELNQCIVDLELAAAVGAKAGT